MKDINLIHGDCIKEMGKIPNKSIDLILTDIPYDVINRNDNGLKKLDKDKADIITFDINMMLKELYRICKGSIYIFCSTEQLSYIRENMIRNGMSTRIIVWEKNNPSPMNGDKIWLSGIELCVYGKFPKATFNAHCRNSVLKYPIGRSKVHPTEKNLKLFEDLIQVSSNKGDVVLDCCMGSGTTGIGCVNLDRKFIGIELDEKYFKLASDRINQALELKNQELF